MKNLLLGSNSPRRKELLTSLGYDFEVVKIDCDEVYPKQLNVSEIAGFLAQLKADEYYFLKENQVLLTADTIVVFENEVLGKPHSKEEAVEMLSKLSGNTHQVYTGICLKYQGGTKVFTDCAHVSFKDISPEEIDYYISNFQPFDKAGSYGIQEWIGMSKIYKIEGSYYTIMGLPTHLVYEHLNPLLQEF